jgi:hypothetical protein
MTITDEILKKLNKNLCKPSDKKLRRVIKVVPDVWNKYIYRPGDAEEIIVAINKVIKDCSKITAAAEKRARTTLEFSTKEINEESLERCLTVVNQDKLKNKVAFDRKEQADLINPEKRELIELKQWGNTDDSPLYALVEALKYRRYFEMCGKLYNTISILAPTEYFKRYNKSTYSHFEGLIGEFEKEYKITIILKELEIDKSEFEKMVKTFNKKLNKKCKEVYIPEYEKIDEAMRKKLQYDNWKEYECK